MIHYHVWFSLKPEIAESDALAHARAFIAELCEQGRLIRGTVLKNNGAPPSSALPPYHVVFEFHDEAHMNASISGKREEGIHVGPHGHLMRSVAEFRVEIFREIQVA
jgi:hypothetical protein